ncbi:MAG: ribonuclease [Saprospiraceae bacterium]|nr:ribonuclease [Candidatus Vicinibacter affinis]MBK9643039.1 ribonuclease [Candidatus Vicinibacter affinis]
MISLTNLSKNLAWLFAIAGLLACKQDKTYFNSSLPQEKVASVETSVDSFLTENPRYKKVAGIPEQVYIVLDYVKKHNKPLPGFEGGRTFYNREKKLPKTNIYNIVYREWDIYPKVKGKNRGAERLITGSDGNAYYTNNHYRTFIKIFPIP